jgi:hypothetical protein
VAGLKLHTVAASSVKVGTMVRLAGLDPTVDGNRVVIAIDDGVTPYILLSTRVLTVSTLAGSTPTVEPLPVGEPFVLRVSSPDEIRVSSYGKATVEIPAHGVQMPIPAAKLRNALLTSNTDTFIRSAWDGSGPVAVQRVNLRVTASEPNTSIMRYSGFYSPVLRTVPLFYPSDVVLSVPRVVVFRNGLCDEELTPITHLSLYDDDDGGAPVIGGAFDNEALPPGPGPLHACNRFYATTIDGGKTRARVADGLYLAADVRIIPARCGFNEEAAGFGMTCEIAIGRVLQSNNLLQATQQGNDSRAIYPRIDEHGVELIRRFIFKSSWDDAHFQETVRAPVVLGTSIDQTPRTTGDLGTTGDNGDPVIFPSEIAEVIITKEK